MEKIFAIYEWPKYFNIKIKLISFIFLSLEFVEHFSVQCNKVIVAFHCKNSTEQSLKHLFKKMSFHQIFDIIPYSHFIGVMLQVVNTCFACCWTYVDLFIILINLYIAARFQQIARQVKFLKNNNFKSESKWKRVREGYTHICRICHLMNEKLSNFILLSFFTNVYFIIFHSFRSLTKRETHLETVYFAISFGLLILRATCVCWFGGSVYEKSEAPLHLLASTSSQMYNIEIEKFVYAVGYQRVGFTGKNFFRINKSLILKIVSAVLTYELIFIQILGISGKKASRYSLCE
ncbi:gustatory receptor for sugar taste 64a-like isoform X2 [Tenebrio molitor]